MKVALLYNKFLDHNGDRLILGGVETYLYNLALLCQELGHEPTIYQCANVSFQKRVASIPVIGIPLTALALKKRNLALFKHSYSQIDGTRDLLIFGADHASVPTHNARTISIQHGISWDLPTKFLSARPLAKYAPFAQILKRRVIAHYKQCFENCPNTVCVDYNFLNWYRTTISETPSSHRIWVIPNFSPIAQSTAIVSREYSDTNIRILFARRFVAMRGTRIFADALEPLLKMHPNIYCTFAGEGPDESWLRSRFCNNSRVSFMKYLPDQTLDVHLKHDIAVIPSIASEGTSLSVAEAMACGCTVLATAVGGITNMIISNYNGILSMPDHKSLQVNLDLLIRNQDLRKRLSINAYKTAEQAFSLEHWKSSWKKVIHEIAE